MKAQVALTSSVPTFSDHRGGMILVLGILGIPCFVLGIIAWILANQDLAKMNIHRMDSRGRQLTLAGKTLGIIGTFLAVFGILLGVALLVSINRNVPSVFS